MAKSDDEKRYSFDKQIRCRICVEGPLHEDWSERLGGLRITRGTLRGQAVTELTGQLCDQTELAGVLDSLYNLHVTILLVECHGDE